MTPNKEDYENERKRVWLKAWCSTMRGGGGKNLVITPIDFADACLKAYDKEFSKPLKGEHQA